MPQKDELVRFITGCSTGFGREIAKLVLECGYRAAITARSPDKVQDIIARYGERALALRLDVTDASRFTAAVRDAETAFGAIDVLVNDAGYGLLAAVEESEETV